MEIRYTDALKKHCNKLRHNCYKCEHKKTFCPIIEKEKKEIKPQADLTEG